MKRGEMRGGFPYPKIYQDLAKAIRELGELEVLAMVNSQLRDRGLQRKRRRAKQATETNQ